MIPRLHHASSKLPALTRVYHGARLTFSSSAVVLARKLPQRSTGERVDLSAADRRPREAEDAVKEGKSDAGGSEGEEQLDPWLLAGEETANESAIRSYKDPYSHFRKKVASSFREPSPRNWLGHDVPFPLNPSFKPPIPLSDEIRTRLYRAYMTNPKLNSVRALAARHNISIKRVDAILRLKGMEEAWKKNKPLQTGFTKGMEHLLGVTEAVNCTEQDIDELLETDHAGESSRPDRYDVEEADMQDQVEGNSKARQRYQRLFWESVGEGEDPIMPDFLASQRSATLARTKFRGKTTLVERAPGRSAIKFIDVGNAFVDEKEKTRREREGARKSTLKAREWKRDQGLLA